MKLICGLVLLLSFNAFADVISVSKMTREGGFDRSFVLKTNYADTVVIDCQSFIQGLRIGEGANAYTYLLDPYECNDLQGRIRRSLIRFHKHCIDVDQEIRADYSC